MKRVAEGTFQHVAGGDWRAVVYANTVEYQEHLALVKGDVSGPEPVLVRMHAVDLLDDMTGGAALDRGAQRDAHDRQARAAAWWC